MIAEDYRQLFGTPTAAAAPQMNTSIPPANQVPGLRDFLSTTFRQAPAGSQSPPPPSSTTLTVSGLGVNPQPVKSSATVSFNQSTAATDAVQIVNSSGAVVRTLLANASRGAGTVSVAWNRQSDAGRRVSSGTYTATVNAQDAGGHSVTASASFKVG